MSSSKAFRRRLRARLVHVLLRGLAAVFGPLSLAAVQRIGRGLGRLAWRLAGRDRRRTLDHLALAMPELADSEREDLGRAVFRHQATNLTENLWLLSRDCGEVERIVAVEGWEIVEALREEGRGVLIVTGHCGNWELLAAVINCRGLGMRVVARALDEAQAQKLLVGLRSRFGTTTIERGESGAARELLKALRAGALGMLIDQDTKVDGVWVPFFGRPAFTPVGAAKIAARPGVAAVPTFIERRDDGSHLVRFHPPLELPEDLTEATGAMTQAIEDQIRRCPEQWVWMHRRWRRQPPAA